MHEFLHCLESALILPYLHPAPSPPPPFSPYLPCQVTTEEQRSEFREALMDAEDWLYGDGEHELAAGYRKRLTELRTVGNPIARRAAELVTRPKVKGEEAAGAFDWEKLLGRCVEVACRDFGVLEG